MRGKSLLRWLGPVCTVLVGILGAILVRTGIIPDLMFKGDFYFPLSALILFISMLTAIIWAVISVGRMVAEKRLQRSLKQVRAAQLQEKQRFLRRLDHELKNPLTTIRLGIANLEGGSNEGEEMSRSLQRISLQAQRLQALVENLRRLTDMDEKSLDRSEVNLGEVLEEAIEIACENPERKTGTVNLTIQQVPWPLSPIYGDRDLLMVAFRNLIENALKFSGADGRVEVRASEDGHQVLVEIDDNGRGIPPGDQPFIFDELYRGENARDLPGSGLGLALVRRIIELHGGSLRVNSRPELGTMVRVELPVQS